MLGDGSKYPSDDTYLDTETGKRYSVECTVAAHFSMPDEVDSLDELTAMPGVCKDVKEL
jgi:hypothetical protein